MDQLDKVRQQIDEIDEKIAKLFEKRMQAVQQVIAYKKQTGKAILDQNREKQVIEKNLAYIHNPELKKYYGYWQQNLMDISKAYQQEILGKNVVAYQGIEGAFSHIALQNLFPHATAEKYTTWKEVFEAVQQGKAAYGILPFENSTTGDIGEVLDLCFTQQCFIWQMYDLKIVQNVLGLPDATINEIKTVYSHPQGLRQSAKFLNQLQLKGVEYPNTAMAADAVAKAGDNTIAAIASAETAQIYGLKVLAQAVNDTQTNTTRFIVIAPTRKSCGNRFNLLFTVNHTAGKLATVVAEIAKQGFNMECIKSRPLPNNSWEYYFYVEIVGNIGDQAAQNLIDSLKKICPVIKLLGVYDKEDNL